MCIVREAGMAIRAISLGLVLAATVIALPVSVMAAPPVPNAGSLLRDIEKGKPSLLPGKGSGLEIPLPPEMKSLGGMKVTVKEFRFAGNHLFDDQTLASVVKPWLNCNAIRSGVPHADRANRRIRPVLKKQHPVSTQSVKPVHRPASARHTAAQQKTTHKGALNCQLSFRDLQNAARAVAKYYRDEGWVVRTYLPRQDISTGIVTIQVVEARFGGIKANGKSIVSRESVDRLIRKAQPIGKPIRLSAIERGVLLANDLPGVKAKYILTKGKRDRETDLALVFVGAPRTNAYVRVDNGGTRATGAGRIITNLGINSPGGVGDKVDLLVMGSRGLLYGKFSYTRPVGADGWIVGASLSSLKYRLGKEFNALQLKGSATTVGVSARYPVIRSRAANLYFSASLQHKIYDNEAQGVITSHYTVDVPELSLSGNYYDRLWGAAATNASVSFVRGRVDLSGSPNAAAVAATARTNGEYSRVNVALSRQQSLGESLSAYLSFSGQYASKNLDSSEFMTLGGPDGVRAYPVAEGAGGSGWLLNVELRQLLPYHFTLIPFYDRGFIKVNRDNTFTGASALNRYTLQGAGISLHWDPEPTLGIKVAFARRIGKNPARTLNGLDQDGSFHRYRVWVDGTYQF